MASDPTLPFTTLRIGDVDYKLCFDFNAIAEAEQKLIAAKLLKTTDSLLFMPWVLNLTSVPLLFAAALLRYQPDINLDEATAMVGWGNVIQVTNAVVKARDQFFPEPAGEEEASPEAVPDPPATDS